ncbi:RNA polymerase-associated protein RapA [Marinobacterium marinum]|uniref:RNA polymerase-associated protein RapA n=1 Tax=Marinobacterium marinum TaxID=2756129 RepID=A0A7W1WYP1_9GAMM|nr:RNA polymerase-associated protein RapA [Marinobacterium marinum]MBA4502564.1 RNA polymerase-associated protein RapA [Marinobacterium marinum]
MSQAPFVPGQRWISNSEAELGLGIVVEYVNRRVEIRFPAAEETRTYAADNAPLSRVAYEPGDRVSNVLGDEMDIAERFEHNQCFIYRGVNDAGEEVILPELELDSAVHFSKPQERLFAGQLDRNGLFKLRVATLERQHRLRSSSAYGLLGARVQLLPHQFYIASELSGRMAPRALLADEVGLGKTIEAGLVLHQRLISGRARRVLVVVPDTLVHQWLVEMLRRFNLMFTLLDEARCAEIEASGQDNPFESGQLVICPLSLLTRSEARQVQAEAAGWDILVVDEAHHLGWSEEAPSHAYLCIEALAQKTPGVLLLTATPEQLGPEGHFARLRLLDPARYPDLQQFLNEEHAYLQLNNLIEPLLGGQGSQVLAADADLQSALAERLGAEAITRWLQLDADTRPAALDELIRQLIDRQGTGRVLFRNTRDTVAGFPQRQLQTQRLDMPPELALFDEEVAPESWLHPEKIMGSDWIDADTRVEWLVEWLKQNRSEKVLVICAHADTAVALEDQLNLREGIRSAVFHEGLSLVNRDRAAAYFAEEELGAQVLVCSEIGSEGRNFQFAHHLVLFDLPLTPDLLEQRIGRLDRIGQREDIQIHVPVYEGGTSEALLRWYDEGLDAFGRVCAVGDALYRRFAPQLLQCLNAPDDVVSLEALITETRQARENLEHDLSRGRDRLLEVSSCHPQRAGLLLDEVAAAESSEQLQAFAEKLFDRFGVDIQPHGPDGLVLHPGEHMLCQLPGLPEDGVTLTFNRERALSREDIQFMSWEHPLLTGTMELISTGELGNCTVCTLKLPPLQAGTLLLELVYELRCAAPRYLQLERYLPSGSVRMLVDPEGRDLAGALGHEPLNQLLQTVSRATGQKMVRLAREQVAQQLKAAEGTLDTRVKALREQALDKLRQQRAAEYDRLVALAQVNPMIRQEELDAMVADTEQMESALQAMELKLDAIRVILVRE